MFGRRNRRASVWNRQAVETLEVRNLPAGNVAVSVVDGVLTIRGDNQPNYVAIRQIPQTFTGDWPGAGYEIRTDVTVSRNLFKDAPSPTGINGDRSQTTIQVSGVNRGVNINLRGGDDGLFIGSGNSAKPTVNLPGTVFIDAGAGDDDLRLYATNRREARFSGGYGNDSILLGGGPFSQLAVQTNYGGVNNRNGTGGRISLVALTVNGPLELRGSPGAETVQVFAGSVFRSRITMDFGGLIAGNNFTTRIDAASGVSGVPATEYRGPIFVTGGDQSDFIGLTSALVFDSVTAFLGAGNDRMDINAASGTTVDLNVDLGPGESDDAFLLGTFSGQISGGPGNDDELIRRTGDEFGDVNVSGFEVFRMF